MRIHHLIRNVLFVVCLPFVGGFSTGAVAAIIEVPQMHARIQAAIDAAQSGDTVLVSAGTYHEALKLKSGISVRSRGDQTKGKLGLKRAEDTVIDLQGAQNAAGITMAEDSVLDGFTVTNVGRYDDAEWKKHHGTQGNDQPHEHIGAPGVAGISITGITCVVTNNIVHHIGYTGIAITGVKGQRCSPTILRNVCYRNMGGGIGSMSGSTAIIEENVCFQNFYAGIGHEGAHPLVLNNECYENIRAGIGVSEGARPIVRGNRCYKNRRAGIGIRTAAETSPIIEFNDCYENDMAGIGCEDSASPIIRENRCHHNRMAGIGSQDHATPVISKNECEHNELAGIGARGGAVALIHANQINNNKLAGIGVEERSTATLLNNTCRDNGLVAIGVRHESSVLMAHNTLSRSGGMPPLMAVRESSTAHLIDNRLQGGGIAGILVDGNLTAINNDFVGDATEKGGPPSMAVWAQKNSTVMLSNNRITGCRTALQADGAKQVTVIENVIRRFVSAAMNVKNNQGPVRISGNRAYSNNDKDRVLVHDGSGETSIDNERVADE